MRPKLCDVCWLSFTMCHLVSQLFSLFNKRFRSSERIKHGWRIHQHGAFELGKSAKNNGIFQQTMLARCILRNEFMNAANHWRRNHLVGGLEHDFYFSIYWEFHHPNWRVVIFQRGRAQPPTRYASEMVTPRVGWRSPCWRSVFWSELETSRGMKITLW